MTVLSDTMTERDLEYFVRAAAQRFGWFRFHVYRSKGSEPGWPDEVLLRPPEMIVAELKSAKGKVTEAQERVLAMLEACGIETYIWRPSDLDAILERLANVGPGK